MKKKLLFVFIISLLSVSYGFAQENKLKPVDSLTKKDKIKLMSIYYPPNPPIQNSPVLKERS